MKKFDTLYENYFKIVLEQDAPGMAPAPQAAAPAPDAGGSALPGMGGGAPGGMGDMGGMGGDPSGQGSPDSQNDMDNEAKRETDPREYTRSILALLVDNKEGVTPEMFDDFIDSVSLAITKIKDKPGIKQFYATFYKRLDAVLSLREELKSMFKQLSGTLDDLVGAKEEPNAAGGGEGMAGPRGPGVT
ncbi:MAG: hypothetical protein PHS54_00345 [Clostridia bacterium]|nr:hypothetical protein [Clostridia bacterium]